jgi:hypothetical protein
MPDTPQNRACYPQPNTQTPGVGFPPARLVMVICMATGAALDMGLGPHSGKAAANSRWSLRSLFEAAASDEFDVLKADLREYFLTVHNRSRFLAIADLQF